MKFAYLIQSADNGRRMSSGVISVDPPPSLAELAAELVQRNRAEHSYYTGPRTCWVWAHDGQQSLTRLETGPDGAERFDL
ncbi:hypothetical protein ACFYY2_17460 [Streptomyces sp. NPDC001822]|uniref:hypothetical protein n=1 Tax=Streptomyces sp. NPDC001822 TaxID=3364614 RepID=UPI003676F036